jgi:hypothetical protein
MEAIHRDERESNKEIHYESFLSIILVENGKWLTKNGYI